MSGRKHNRQGSEEHRRLQSQRMKAWLALPENRAAHAERQRKRFQTEEGKAHIRRMHAAQKPRFTVPPEFRRWYESMQKSGIPVAERRAAIAKALAAASPPPLPATPNTPDRSPHGTPRPSP